MASGFKQFIGARYIPIFGRVGEESAQWDNSEPYEALTIVVHEGNSYTSRKAVPAGIDIADEEYWAKTGAYNAQFEEYVRKVDSYSKDVVEYESEVETYFDKVDTTIDKAKSDVNEMIDNCKSDVSKSIDNAEADVAASIEASEAKVAKEIADCETEVNAVVSTAADAKTAAGEAKTAAADAKSAAETATTAAGTATDAAVKAQATASQASTDVKALAGYFNLDHHQTITSDDALGFSNCGTFSFTCAYNSTGSVFKFYGTHVKDSNTSMPGTCERVAIPGVSSDSSYAYGVWTGIKIGVPDAAYCIYPAGFKFSTSASSTDRTAYLVEQGIVVGNDGYIYIYPSSTDDSGLMSKGFTYRISYYPSIYFNANFGDTYTEDDE